MTEYEHVISYSFDVFMSDVPVIVRGVFKRVFLVFTERRLMTMINKATEL